MWGARLELIAARLLRLRIERRECVRGIFNNVEHKMLSFSPARPKKKNIIEI